MKLCLVFFLSRIYVSIAQAQRLFRCFLKIEEGSTDAQARSVSINMQAEPESMGSAGGPTDLALGALEMDGGKGGKGKSKGKGKEKKTKKETEEPKKVKSPEQKARAEAWLQ